MQQLYMSGQVGSGGRDNSPVAIFSRVVLRASDSPFSPIPRTCAVEYFRPVSTEKTLDISQRFPGFQTFSRQFYLDLLPLIGKQLAMYGTTAVGTKRTCLALLVVRALEPNKKRLAGFRAFLYQRPTETK